MMVTCTALFRIPQIRRKILITIFVLVLFRLIAKIPVMPFDLVLLEDLIKEDQLVFAWEVQCGGTLSSLSVLSLGLSPYYAGVLLTGTLAKSFPLLSEVLTSDRQRFQWYSCLFAIPLGMFQSLVLLGYLRHEGVVPACLFCQGHFLDTFTQITTLVAGSFLVYLLAEVISEVGVGEGRAVLIFGGIAARLPVLARSLIRENALTVVVVLVALLGALWISIVVNGGKRSVPVISSRSLTHKYRSEIPILVNRVGTDPLQLSLGWVSSWGLLAVPVADLGWGGISSAAASVTQLLKGPPVFWVLYALGTVYYAIYWQNVNFEGRDVAHHMSLAGLWVPGLRPGSHTANYLERVSNHISVVTVLYLAVLSLYPYALSVLTGVESVVPDITLTVLLGFDTVLNVIRALNAEILLLPHEGFLW